MGRDLTPKCKQERREGVNLFLKGEKSFSSKNPSIKRPFPPGSNSSSRPKRLSGYGTRLREKQKAKKMFRLLEKQFHKYYLMASKLSGDTAENLLRILEIRLDNVFYRLGFADSRDQARQLVNHGHVTINNKKVDIPSYQIKSGDIIAVKKSYLVKKYWQDRLPKMAKAEVPGWLSLDAKNAEGKVVSLPKKEDLQAPFDTKLIIEFYSR